MPDNPSALSVVPNSAVQAVQQTGEKNGSGKWEPEKYGWQYLGHDF